jgi:hypothetical protein
VIFDALGLGGRMLVLLCHVITLSLLFAQA